MTTSALELKGVKWGIAALNSAWRATGAPHDGDYGRLVVGRKQVDEIVESLRECDFRIALVHHPLSWLTPRDSQNTHRQLLVHFDALFHGHNHEPDAQAVIGSSNSYFLSNAGCLYQSRAYFNGYCLVNFDPVEVRWIIEAREYYETRQVFDQAIRFASNGRAEFQRVGAGSDLTLPRLPSDEYIEAMSASFDRRLLPSLVSEVAPPTLKGIFVEPPLCHVSQRELHIERRTDTSNLFVNLKDVLSSKKPTLFLGTKDMGKTTLL